MVFSCEKENHPAGCWLRRELGRPAARCEFQVSKELNMRSGCLWLIGVPIPVIILLWFITGHL
jgi:hypothetical protein